MQSHRAASVGSGYRPNSSGFPPPFEKHVYMAKGALKSIIRVSVWSKNCNIVVLSNTSVEMRHAVVYIVEIR